MTIKHEGISRHRLASNPLEALYAEEWEKEAPGTLGYLLCGQEKNNDYSERDAQVAATIIQWLGSPVGSVFVYDVLEKQKRNEIKARKGKQ